MIANDTGRQSPTGTPPLVHDTEAAIRFLQQWEPKGSWCLTSIIPDGAITTITYQPGDEAFMRDWIETRQGRENLYFSVGIVKGNLTKKATKEEIELMCALHVDVDPAPGRDFDGERAHILKQLQSHDPPPTVIIDSGNGFQGFWLLRKYQQVNTDTADRKTNDERIAHLEAYNRSLKEIFDGGDSCFNIDRLMRLPGTINLPNKKKREIGRVITVSRLVEADWSRLYRLEDFKPLHSNGHSHGNGHDHGNDLGGDPGGVPLDLPKTAPKWLEGVIRTGDRNPSRYRRKNGSIDYSRSVLAAATALIRQGWDDDKVARLLSNPAFAISGHFLNQSGDPYTLALRQSERAREKVAKDEELWERDEKGKIIGSQTNICTALSLLGISLSYDEFADRLLLTREGKEQYIDDAVVDALYLEIDEELCLRPTDKFFDKVIKNEARKNTFHPVAQYLDGLKWDGVSRLDKWLTDYGKAKDTEYVRAVSRLILVAAVRRIRQPGCKFDEMLVLVNPTQGVNKSSALAVLAVRDEWFLDDLPLSAKTQVVIELTNGVWIAEASELKGLKERTAEHHKAFLSRQKDKSRLAWGRFTTERKRQFIVIGTTNEEKFLRDHTGNRRYWPVAVERIDLDALKKVRDQLWAEAAQAESAGESIRLAESLWEAAGKEQDARRVEAEPWIDTIADTLGDFNGKILSSQVWEIVNVLVDRRLQQHNERLGLAMRKNGWTWTQRRMGRKNEQGKNMLDSVYVRGTRQEQMRRIIAHRPNDGSQLVVRYDDDPVRGNWDDDQDDDEPDTPETRLAALRARLDADRWQN